MPNSNPKPELHNINAHTKFGESPLTFTQVIQKRNTDGQTTDRWTDRHMDIQCETIIPRHTMTDGCMADEQTSSWIDTHGRPT